MADLKPIGSEKLQGQDKINRILEIARYKETRPSSINETSRVEFGKTLADGQQYEIVKEKLGYVIKKNVNESLDYIEPMKNRKYYKSYSQALKRMNLLAGELNRLNENEDEVSMFTLEEQKKFTLKLPKQEVPAPEPTPAPEEAPVDDMSLDMEMDAESGDESLDMDMEMDTETPDMGAEEEEVDFKVIQKLTGKLGQKIRTMNDAVGMTSEDIKYVLNSILSALDLDKLDDEDKEDIIAKIEEVETDYDSEDMDIDVTGDEDLDMNLDSEEPVEGEMGEQDDMYLGIGDHGFYDQDENRMKDFDFDYDEEEYDDFDEFVSKYPNQKWFPKDDSDEMDFDFRLRPGRQFWDMYKEKFGGPFKLRKRRGEMGEGDLRDKFDGRDSKVIGVYSNIKKQRNEEMSEEDKAHSSISKIMDSIFSESKVDKVLEKYFVISESEKKEPKKTTSKSFEKISESVEQKLAAEFIMSENSEIKFLGKTNKGNLVFEHNGEQIKISTKGEVL